MFAKRPLTTILLAATALVSFTPPTEAQSWFVEVSRHSFDIGGDFDDSFLLTGPDFVINVPALQQVDGLGIAVGFSGGGGLFSFTHVRANPEARSVLGDETASFRSWGMDLAFAPGLPDNGFSFRPLFRFGGAFTLVRVPDSASDGVTVVEGGYNGLQFNLGVGGAVRLTRYLHLTADFSRRFLSFGVATAYDESLPIDDGLNGNSNAFTIGLGIYPG